MSRLARMGLLLLGQISCLPSSLDVPTNIPRDSGPDRPDLGACGTEGLRCCTGTYDMDAGATCMGSLACVSGRCAACPARQTMCNGACVALSTTDNCGACGNRCANGDTCDLTTSSTMDGGVRGADAGTDASVAYACQVLCRAPMPTRCGTACTSTDTDSMNCGACDHVCSFRNAVGACRGGACQLVACTTGFADCDMSAANGCEVQTNGADENHCGMCDNRCAFPHAAATCAAGTCRLGACEAGYADCDMNPTNGCEVRTNGTDPNNCGRCGMVCPAAPTGSSSMCRTGVCGFSSVVCPAGVANCDGMDGNGCETNLLSSVMHCSMCGRACNGTNGTPSCLGGVCQISCASGFGNCDGVAANGCEINTNTNPSNCGACNRACTLLHATPTCATGACQVGTCDTGFLNCDMNPANGCEVNQNTDTGNCGACGRACLTGQSCVAGVCTFVCPTGQTACGASCFNLQTDPANCGSCGRVCPAPTGTTASCTAGVCGVRIVGCPTGTSDCNGNAADGCEATDVNTNPVRCGATCAVCNGTNGTAWCAAGACGVVCNTGFANCDGLSSNGCETPTTTVVNCGICGNVCNLFAATEACTSMTCTIASCDSGFLNCDGSVANGCEVDGRNNNANCGMCGRACTVSGQACSSGTCQCPTGQTVCTSTCRDLQNDRSNCGTCGNVCPSGQVCSSGLCHT